MLFCVIEGNKRGKSFFDELSSIEVWYLSEMPEARLYSGCQSLEFFPYIMEIPALLSRLISMDVAAPGLGKANYDGELHCIVIA